MNKQINKLELRLRRRKLYAYPKAIYLEPTTKCNSNCVMCNRQLIRKEEVLKGGFLSWDIFNKTRPFLSMAEVVLFGGFGEPLLHSDFIPMAKEIKKYHPYLYFYTNGLLLTPEISKELILMGADEVCISFGGAREETYQYIRGISMAPIVENIKKLNELKKSLGSNKPKISLALVVMKSMFPELLEVVDLAKDMGINKIELANIVVQDPRLQDESSWLHQEECQHLMEDFRKRVCSYGLELLQFNLKESIETCQHIFSSLTITWDGFILSCPQERFILGSLENDQLAKIWNNEKYYKLRDRYYREGISKLCPNCFSWKNDASAFLYPNKNSRAFAEKI
ncbi:MAG: radical SAM protein [bacterium]